MNRMSEIDWSDLDARLLRLLVAIVETGSFTGAAHRLGVTQSAVSHLAGKLKRIVGDVLFVKSGRGIVATARAEALAVRARDILRELERFAHSETFDPTRWRTTFTIAANDLQRDALLPALVQRLRCNAPGVVLRIIPSDAPTPEMLRDERCDIIISPRLPEGADMMQKRLFEDRYRVFYDAERRSPPATKAEYLAADHVTVMYQPQRTLDLDEHLAAKGVRRRFLVMTPGFAAVPAFLRGGDMLATAPSLLRFGLFRDLASAPPPVPCPTMPMFMIWSRRDHDDPPHRFMRAEVEAVARPVAATAR
jgi:DNA-binding transcriptional LysR family regulator